MRFILIASPPPHQFFAGLLFGVLIVVGIIAVFLHRKRGLKWRGLLQLCVLTLVLGPLAGAGLASLIILFGGVHPLDRWWLVSNLTKVGLAAGILATLLLAIMGTIRILSRGNPSPQDDRGETDSVLGEQKGRDGR